MRGDEGAYLGMAAGVATSALWTASSLFFTAAVRRVGPVAVNTFRILLALGIQGALHRLMTGHWMPDATEKQIAFLACSGVLGLSICDQAIFTAFIDIGPRLAMLVMTTAPIFAALFGWMALREQLDGWALCAMALTIGGVGWVVAERPTAAAEHRPKHRVRGVSLALVGAACQAGGLMLSKQGMGHGWLPAAEHLAPQSAALVRMFFAAIGMAPIVAIHQFRWRALSASDGPIRVGSPRAGYALAAGGAVVGPFLGMWMSLVASDRAALGIAQTLCSLTPVFLLPVVGFVYKEKLTYRAVVGAMVAVGGAALLFISPA